MWFQSDLIDQHWSALTFDPASLGRPISNIGIPVHQVLWPYLAYFLRYELWSSLNLMHLIWLISIDWHWPLTYDPNSLGRPISNTVIPLYQVSWPYLSYILRYEFSSSMNFEGVTDIQTDRKQRVVYKSPPCHWHHWHRWAQKYTKRFGRIWWFVFIWHFIIFDLL